MPRGWAICAAAEMGTESSAADDGCMTTTHTFPARFAIATTALLGLTLFAGACGRSTPKASSQSTTTAANTEDPNDSEFCKTARAWMVHELNGDGDSFADDPVALEKYWGEYLAFVAAGSQQAPAEIQDDWSVGYDFLVKEFTPILEKYDFDIERAKAEGTPAELAIGKRVDEGPNEAEQRAQDAVHEYEGRVCQTSQPPAADVSFAGVKVNKSYCDASLAVDEYFGESVAAEKFSIEAMRVFATSDKLETLAEKAKANAPTEIKADVEANIDWTLNEKLDVIEKYGYDTRKLFLEGSAEDRAVFQDSDPAIADHYARVLAYEEQLCEA